MKYLILTLSLFISVALYGQNRVGISEVIMTTSKGDQPAFEFFIPDTDNGAVLNAWVKFHKTFKVKPKQNKSQKNYYFSDNASISELSENTIDIYSRIYETSQGVRFTCAFDLGGVFISADKTPTKYAKTKLLLNKFYAQMAMDAIVEEIEKELAALASIKAEYDAIENEINALDKQTKEYSTNISAQEKEQFTIETTIEDKEAELSSKQTELKRSKDELREIDKAGMIAELSTHESSFKKTDLEATRMQKDIERKEAEIASIQADINILKNDLDQKNELKADLTEKIESIIERLDSYDLESKEEKVKLLEQNVGALKDARADLNLQKSSVRRTLDQQRSKLDKAKEAIKIAKETKSLLKEKITVQESKIRELEELKATIE